MTRPETLHDTQNFFTAKAAGWEKRFPDDSPAFARAVNEMGNLRGTTIIDIGCGTGRALIPLREAVGPTGQVIGLDATFAMLAEAQRLGRRQYGAVLQSDALRLPLPDSFAQAIFAGGLLPHLEDPATALSEFWRVAKPGAALAIFHPIGRVALAARHSNVPSDDDTIAPPRLRQLCASTGWAILSIDDSEERYLALARK